jgi:DNA/RNA-binding domain of Phe-tRNA-synthetase-like protein
VSEPADEVRAGTVSAELAEEFPGLRLAWTRMSGGPRRSPASLRQRLRALSDGHRGAMVVAMRTHAIPQAYRAFFRQIGLDPDATRIPAEEAAAVRLLEGRFRPRGLPADALLVALLETGVGVWAVDGARVEGDELLLRTSRAGERFGSGALARALPAGRLVVADAVRPQAVLFGELAPGHEVSRSTRELAIFGVGVEGVPAIHLEEALWIATDLLTDG